MRFAAIIASLLVSVIASPIASPVEKRVADPDGIIASINRITSDVVTLNNTLNGFEPNLLLNAVQALKIQSQTNAIGDSLQQATGIASRSDPLNEDQSFAVASSVLTFQPQIFSLLDNLQRRKPVFEKAILGLISVTSIVHDSLQRQKQLSASFGVTVASKLSAPFADLAPIVNQQIADRFDEAIADFSS